MVRSRVKSPLLCSLLMMIGWSSIRNRVSVDAAAPTTKKTSNLQDIDNYRVYPVRSQDEAAVIEWGHSAIISALDAAVAHFGPQTTHAALLEVETMPVLAEPVNGVWDNESEDESKSEESTNKKKVRVLDNADEVHGNVVVMTDTGKAQLEGLDLALMAQASGAAALIVVHLDEERPDDIYRLPIPAGREEEAAGIDIPVVVISLEAANVLTSATVTAHSTPDDIINNGMPDRYVRPFVYREREKYCSIHCPCILTFRKFLCCCCSRA